MNIPRPLTRIADRLDDLDSAFAAAWKDGMVSIEEMAGLRRQVQVIAGDVARTDLEHAYALCVQRGGIRSQRCQRLRRELEAWIG